MAIELHLCEGGDFRTTTDFLECGNCTAIIPNKTRADGVVTCGSCGSEWEPDEVPDARVEEIVQAVVDAANLKDERDRLRAALQGLLPWLTHEDPGPGESGDQFRNDLAAARAALGEE